MNKPFFDRRRGSDILVKWVHWSGIVSWCLVAVTLGVALSAKPQQENFFHRFFKIDVTQTWDYQLLRFAFIILVVLFVFCLVSIFFNALRRRRRTDRYNKTILFHLITSLIGIILFSLYMM